MMAWLTLGCRARCACSLVSKLPSTERVPRLSAASQPGVFHKQAASRGMNMIHLTVNTRDLLIISTQSSLKTSFLGLRFACRLCVTALYAPRVNA